MAYEVKLEMFEGPIDLLLHLITRRRVDIYEVSLSTITDEYLAVLKARESLDLDSATGFLVVAATLLELKSARLLPGLHADETDAQLLEERDRLLARLVECTTFREAGSWIAAALEQGGAYHPREVSLEPQLAGLAPDPLGSLSLEQLAQAAGEALAPRPQPELDTSHVSPSASVRDAIAEVAATLQVAGAATFVDLCARVTARIEVVVRFLALLELFKAGAIDLSQHDRFGEIQATWTDEVSAEEVMLGAEEYVAAVPGAADGGAGGEGS